MSTYFAALMRASGLASADAHREVARDGLESRGLEAPTEAGAIARDAPEPPDRSLAPPPTAQPAGTVPRAMEFTASPAQIPSADTARTEPSRVIDGRDGGERPRDVRPSEAASTPSEHATHEAGLLAALRWVRADPQLAHPEEPRDLRVRAIEVEGAAPATPEMSPPMTPTIAHEQPPTVVHATQAFATQAPPAAQAFLLARDGMPSNAQEVVEVSIGAIHVRVDAPAPSARVASAAPAPRPRAQSDAVRTPPRSGLARRALRRI